MTQFNRPVTQKATDLASVPHHQRHPQRITITLNWAVHQQLIERSGYEGRSLSNLAAHLLELSCSGFR
jgi:type II secretory pathway component PulK